MNPDQFMPIGKGESDLYGPANPMSGLNRRVRITYRGGRLGVQCKLGWVRTEAQRIDHVLSEHLTVLTLSSMKKILVFRIANNLG